MPEVRDAVELPVPLEQAMTWTLASAEVLRYELHGQPSDDGLQLLADVWKLNDNSIVLDVMLTGTGTGTRVHVLGRNRGGKLVSEESIRKRVVDLISELSGYGTAFTEGVPVPTTPPPEPLS